MLGGRDIFQEAYSSVKGVEIGWDVLKNCFYGGAGTWKETEKEIGPLLLIMVMRL